MYAQVIIGNRTSSSWIMCVLRGTLQAKVLTSKDIQEIEKVHEDERPSAERSIQLCKKGENPELPDFARLQEGEELIKVIVSKTRKL